LLGQRQVGTGDYCGDRTQKSISHGNSPLGSQPAPSVVVYFLVALNLSLAQFAWLVYFPSAPAIRSVTTLPERIIGIFRKMHENVRNAGIGKDPARSEV
jgi:hypothetical protein